MGISRKQFILGLIGLPLGLQATVAQARHGGRAQITGRGLAQGANHHGPILTRQELRQCIHEQNKLNARAELLEQSQAALDVKKSRLNHMEQQIRLHEPQVNVHQHHSVKSFNAVVNKHRQMIEQFNQNIRTVNAQAEKIKLDIAQFNAKCGKRAYYQSDWNAIQNR